MMQDVLFTTRPEALLGYSFWVLRLNLPKKERIVKNTHLICWQAVLLDDVSWQKYCLFTYEVTPDVFQHMWGIGKKQEVSVLSLNSTQMGAGDNGITVPSCRHSTLFPQTLVAGAHVRNDSLYHKTNFLALHNNLKDNLFQVVR